MILAITGHREIRNYEKFRDRLQATFDEVKPAAFIHGCAAGIDLQSAKIAIDLGISVISAMPWTTHKPRVADRELYSWVIQNSVECYPVTEAESYPGAFVYHRRNKWMIDECDRVLAWYDGRGSGGTLAAIAYANKVRKPVRNIYTKET